MSCTNFGKDNELELDCNMCFVIVDALAVMIHKNASKGQLSLKHSKICKRINDFQYAVEELRKKVRRIFQGGIGKKSCWLENFSKI